MKKLFLVTVFMLLILPSINAFAEYKEGGLLNGKPLLDKNGVVVTDVTDGNLLNYYRLYVGNTLSYEFYSPVNISSFYYELCCSNNVAYYPSLLFFDSNGNEIYRVNSNRLKDIYEEEVSLSNVSKVQIKHMSGTNTAIYAQVKELELYGSSLEPISDLTESHNYNSVSLDWDLPENALGTVIKQDGVQIADLNNNVSSYSITGLNSESTYNFEVIAKYASGYSEGVLISVTTDIMPLDTNPPSEILNLSFGVSSSGVAFIYDLPIDSDFSHLKIYRDGELLETNYKSNTFKDEGLIPNTSYVYKFVSVDVDGNSSNGYITTIKTNPEIDSVAPNAPTNIQVKNGNGGASVIWDKNLENDLVGYNVYLDGTKVNSNLIIANNYVISNLSNEETYSVFVTAVDSSGNESLSSDVVNVSPTVAAMPIFELDYDLSDIADGTSSWFSAFWLILAFSVGIPLAFIIGNRVKHLFFA